MNRRVFLTYPVKRPRISSAFLLIALAVTTVSAETAAMNVVGNLAGVELLEDSTAQIVFQYQLDPNIRNPHDMRDFYLSIPYGVTYSASMSDYCVVDLKDMRPADIIVEGTTEVPLITDNECLRLHDIFWRDLRLLRVRLEPSRVSNYTSGNSGVIERALFTIVFSGSMESLENYSEGAFEDIYREVVLNYESSKTRRGRIRKSTLETESSEFLYMPDGTPSLRFSVGEAGIYRLTRKRLDALGVSWDALDTLGVWRNGSLVPVALRSECESGTAPDEYLLFFAPKPGDAFNPKDVYWVGRSSHGSKVIHSSEVVSVSPNIVEMTSFPETLEFREQNIFPKEGHPSPVWYWKVIHLSRGGDILVPFSLPDIDAAAHEEKPISISVKLYNASAHDTNVEIAAPGDRKYEFCIARYSEHIAAVTMDIDEMLPRELSLKISVEGSSASQSEKGSLYLESVTVEYVRQLQLQQGRLLVTLDAGDPDITRRLIFSNIQKDVELEAFDVISPASPVCLTGGIVSSASQVFLEIGSQPQRIAVQAVGMIPEPEGMERDRLSNLKDPQNRCDYIILSHSAFLPELESLRRHREEEGLKVLLIDVQDVYDEFSNGLKSIDSIRAFFQYALSHWQKPLPSYALLVGDANWDPWDRRGLGIPDYIPSYLSERRPYNPAEDNWFFLADQESGFENMLWGRLAVQSARDVKSIVDKILINDLSAPLGWWRSRVLFVSDDGFEREMEKSVEKTANEGAICVRAFQSDFPYVTNMRLRENGMKVKFCTAATAEILNQIDRGCLAYYYMGHGGASVMSAERIFLGGARGDSDVLKLNNAPMFPMFFSMSCLTGLFTFDEPAPGVSIAEDWLTRPNKGGVAAYCPSGKGGTADHMVLAEGINAALMRSRMSTFGQVFGMAKIRYMSRRRSATLNNQYIFFGDPASRPVFPSADVDIFPKGISKSVVDVTDESILCRVSDESLFNASAEMKLTTLAGETLWRHGPVSLMSGELQVRLPLSPGRKIDGQLSCYVWDEGSRRDALGSIRVRVALPNLRLSMLSVRTNATEDRILADVKVENTGTIPTTVPLTFLWRCNEIEERLTIPPLEVGAVHSVTTECHVPAGVYNIEAILDPEREIEEIRTQDNRMSKRHLLAGTKPLESAAVDLLMEEVRYNVKPIGPSTHGVQSVTAELKAILWNYGGYYAEGLRVVFVENGSESVLHERKPVSIPAGGSVEVITAVPVGLGDVRVDVYGPVVSRPPALKRNQSQK